jgi:hypothetical protein
VLEGAAGGPPPVPPDLGDAGASEEVSLLPVLHVFC